MNTVGAAVLRRVGLRYHCPGDRALAWEAGSRVLTLFPTGVGQPKAVGDGWETARRCDRPPVLQVRRCGPRWAGAVTRDVCHFASRKLILKKPDTRCSES